MAAGQRNNLGNLLGGAGPDHDIGQSVKEVFSAESAEGGQGVSGVAVKVVGVGEDVIATDDVDQRLNNRAIQHGIPRRCLLLGSGKCWR